MSACFSATSGDCTLIRVCPVGLQIIQNSSRVFRAYSYKYALQNIGFSYSDLSPILNLTFAPRKTSYPLPGKSNLTLLRYHVTTFALYRKAPANARAFRIKYCILFDTIFFSFMLLLLQKDRHELYFSCRFYSASVHSISRLSYSFGISTSVSPQLFHTLPV